MDLTKYIITLIFSTVGVGGIILYLGKRFIDKALDLAVENYRNTLNRNLESHKADLLRQTEEFKAGLKILELEHQIKYTKLHEERASSIKNIYSLLIELQTKLSALTTLFQGPEWTQDRKKESDARESLDSLKNYFLLNRIYFKQSLCDQIDEILNLSWSIIVDMSVNKSKASYHETGPEAVQALKEWQEIDRRVTKEINSARLNLENEFRKLIGSE
jgi:hypothetical protein